MDTPKEFPVDYSGVPVVTLEAIRLKLSQLVHSLANLSQRVAAAEPPAWPTLLQLFNVALLQLSSLATALASVEESLKSSVVYPLPSFPVATKSWLLTTLLRKKNLPEVEEWVSKGKQAGEQLDPVKDDEFGAWALELAQTTFAKRGERGARHSDAAPQTTSVERTIGFLNGREF